MSLTVFKSLRSQRGAADWSNHRRTPLQGEGGQCARGPPRPINNPQAVLLILAHGEEGSINIIQQINVILLNVHTFKFERQKLQNDFQRRGEDVSGEEQLFVELDLTQSVGWKVCCSLCLCREL